MTNCSWKPNNIIVTIVLLIFYFKIGISFHWPNGLSTNQEHKCVTSLESKCFGFSSMVLSALRLILHVDAEMMNVGIKPGVIKCTTRIEAVIKTFSINEAMKCLSGDEGT